MQRIRYTKKEINGESLLVSSKMFTHPDNGARFKVVLNPDRLEYMVIDDVVDIVSASGSHRDLHRLKIDAKKALVALGISFDEEERAKTSIEIDPEATFQEM